MYVCMLFFDTLKRGAVNFIQACPPALSEFQSHRSGKLSECIPNTCASSWVFASNSPSMSIPSAAGSPARLRGGVFSFHRPCAIPRRFLCVLHPHLITVWDMLLWHELGWVGFEANPHEIQEYTVVCKPTYLPTLSRGRAVNATLCLSTWCSWTAPRPPQSSPWSSAPPHSSPAAPSVSRYTHTPPCKIRHIYIYIPCGAYREGCI
jgi:hypothetical protein